MGGMIEVRYISTCAGIGGFELAIQLETDWECVGFSELDYEIDKKGRKHTVFAKQCYKHHFKDHKDLGDITLIDIEGLPDFDLLVGGSPCQDLSVAKKNRQGLKGERSKLFFRWLEILRVKRPKYFILENVNSMTKANKEAITNYIKERYPEVSMTMIDAALVSAQSRKRCFWTNFPVTLPEDRHIYLKDILEPVVDEKYFIRNPTVLDKLTYMKGKKKKPNGFQEGAIRFPQTEEEKPFPLLKSENSISRTSNYVAQAQRVYDVERGKSVTLSSNAGGLGAKTGLYIMPEKSFPIDANYHKGTDVQSYFERHKRQIVSGCALRTYPRIPNGEERSKNCEEREDGKAICLTSVHTDSMVKHNTITEAIGRTASSSEHISSVNKIDELGYGIRKLTPIECERLQSFPDGYTSMLSNSQRYKCLGNAVNVEVVRHIIKCLKEEVSNEKRI